MSEADLKEGDPRHTPSATAYNYAENSSCAPLPTTKPRFSAFEDLNFLGG